MKDAFKILLIVGSISLLILGMLLALFVASTNGYIPEGTRYVYEGFSFDTRYSKAHQLRVDDPDVADLYIILAERPILAKDVSKAELTEAKFDNFVDNAFRNSEGGVFSFADFSVTGRLSHFSIPSNSRVTIPFAAKPTGPQLKLPITTKEIVANFGKPLKKEWIYSKAQWR